ncbi:unnamed protein product [Pneumocystis jirovecii]|uniref:Dolichyl-phosphate-mannose--protein mannosyltransferase n=1 Tax=Pneumocystis jirovecii TaxID=42068 RepID=L0P8U1_PNEJI|nr:unnamed protein product [Pneumocystis jirovecii]
MELISRNREKKEATVQEITKDSEEIKEKYPKKSSNASKNILLLVIFILSILTRFYYIQHPSEVVFDEVHFGKFLSLYLRGSYFFDVHPPFTKLLYAFFGWIIGYDGHFLFEKIGDSYIKNNVPYVYLRCVPAFAGAMVVPLVFLIMKDSGHSLLSSTLAASLVLFDNAQVAQSRLILLDSVFIFLMTSSIYCYIRFSNLNNRQFSASWWKWLFLTGLFLSCTISTKYVGLFTYITIGVMVLIELWDILDIRKGYTMHYFTMHFLARALCLIFFPFMLYLLWFYIHFNVLSKTGPGDKFMSSSFQETLEGNVLSTSSFQVNYYDKITIIHKETNAYLHSHEATYPLRYEDGRISSQGQQVTGYKHNDSNNHWIIMPAYPSNKTLLGSPVLDNDYIRLKHVSTNTYLLTHDVASPKYPTNQEFTTISENLKSRYNETIFQIKFEHHTNNSILKTKGGRFMLIHNLTRVAMWSDIDPLPDWGFKQQEVNGNKKLKGQSNIWIVDEIVDFNDTSRVIKNSTLKSLSFFQKYIELQFSMLHHNSRLKASHPYSSYPIEWPLLNRGISFWTNHSQAQQIYLLGNPIGWWFEISFVIIFVTVVISDQILLRRGLFLIRESRKLFYTHTIFFFLFWIAHYFPFYLMGRKLFLHHYLPAHIASSLLTGSTFQLLFEKNNRSIIFLYFFKKNENKTNMNLKNFNSPRKAKIMFILLISSLLGSFIFFSPLTYGKPGLTSNQLYERKWSPNWDYAYLEDSYE